MNTHSCFLQESRPRIKRRKKSKAHFQELMIEVDQMERVSTYTQVSDGVWRGADCYCSEGGVWRVADCDCSE